MKQRLFFLIIAAMFSLAAACGKDGIEEKLQLRTATLESVVREMKTLRSKPALKEQQLEIRAERLAALKIRLDKREAALHRREQVLQKAEKALSSKADSANMALVKAQATRIAMLEALAEYQRVHLAGVGLKVGWTYRTNRTEHAAYPREDKKGARVRPVTTAPNKGAEKKPNVARDVYEKTVRTSKRRVRRLKWRVRRLKRRIATLERVAKEDRFTALQPVRAENVKLKKRVHALEQELAATRSGRPPWCSEKPHTMAARILFLHGP